MTITQRLKKEQYDYEFPSKQYLKALDYLDFIAKSPFFDPSSFISSPLQLVSSSSELIDDNNLSPLQLPAQISVPSQNNPTTKKENVPLPVGPASFLSGNYINHMHNHVTRSRATSLCIHKDYSDVQTVSTVSSPKIVLIRLNKSNDTISIIKRLNSISDEGYDDNEKEQELESESTFYCLSNDQDEREKAAIKIQALWRGYSFRKNQLLNHLNPIQRIILNTARNNHNKLDLLSKKVSRLELQLREETAMRMAFEKAMEDMTVLIDQQQKVLYDRLENEVELRQMYEDKLNQSIPQLESKLKKEMNARSRLEEMMSRVLDQLHQSETLRIQQAKEEAESKKAIQSQLNLVMNELTYLKKSSNNSNSTLTSNSNRSKAVYNNPKKPVMSNTMTTTNTKLNRNNSIIPHKISSTTTNNVTRKVNNNIITPKILSNTRNTTNNNFMQLKKPASSANSNQNIKLVISSSSSSSSSSSTTNSSLSSFMPKTNRKPKVVTSTIERPSVIPSNKRPLSQKTRKTYI